MKNVLIIFLMCLSYSLFSQSNTNTNNIKIQNSSVSAVQLANEAKKEQGTTYLGNGNFMVTKVGGSGFVSLKKLEKRAVNQIEDYVSRNNLNYKIINVEKYKSSIGVFPKVEVTYQLLTTDGELIVTKDEIEEEKSLYVERLLELKKLKEEGILTEEEYETESELIKSKLLDSK